MNGGGGPPPGDAWDGFSAEELRESAPEIHAAAERAWPSSPYTSLAEWVAAAVWWDTIRCMSEFGADPRSTPAGAVLCRECGRPVEGSVAPAHCGGAHGMSEEEYRAEHPAAPVTAGERAALPDPGIDWG